MEDGPPRTFADVAFLTGRSGAEVSEVAKKLGLRSENPAHIDSRPQQATREVLAHLTQSRAPVVRPGLSATRLLSLIDRAIEATELDLSGLIVLTEAATGIYSVTPVIAARAGAKQVLAVTRASRFGSVGDAVRSTMGLAVAGGVAERVTVTEQVRPEHLSSIDIVTNSGHLRPLTRDIIGRLTPPAVIALMYEAWEFRPSDLDLGACVERGIPVVGVNEREPSVDVFSYLGELCARHMQRAGVSVGHNRIALLCDNDFAEPIRSKLAALGGIVSVYRSVGEVPIGDWDCVILALQPDNEARIGGAEVEALAVAAPPSVVVVQFWGDVDRQAAASRGLQVWPSEAPPPGHMAALLSDLGPEPVVRLQTGGLRAAECVRRAQQHSSIVQLLQASPSRPRERSQ